MPQEACIQIKEELVACVIRSDCVLKSDRSISDCIKNRQDLPARCQHLITSFTDCKRGMLDMRRRFRGNHLSDQEKLGERGSAGVVGNVEISPDSPEKR